MIILNEWSTVWRSGIFYVCVISGNKVSLNGANKVTSICTVSCWMRVSCITLYFLLPHLQCVRVGHRKIRSSLFCCPKVTRCLDEPSFSGDVEDESVAGISQTLYNDKFVPINSYLKILLCVIWELMFILKDAQIFAPWFLIKIKFERRSCWTGWPADESNRNIFIWSRG